MVIHSLMGFPRSFGPPQSIQSLPASARLLQLGLRHAIATCRCTWPRQHRKLRLQSTQRGGLWAVFLTWQRGGKRWETAKSLYKFSRNCGNIMEHPMWILGHVRIFLLDLFWFWLYCEDSWEIHGHPSFSQGRWWLSQLKIALGTVGPWHQEPSCQPWNVTTQQKIKHTSSNYKWMTLL